MRIGDTGTTRRLAPAKTAMTAGLAVAAIVAVTVASAGQAVAQALCMPRAQIVEMLDTHYAEAPIARGLAAGGRLMEVFSSPDGNTWTLLLTTPDGTSCLMGEGQGWSSLPGPLLGQVS